MLEVVADFQVVLDLPSRWTKGFSRHDGVVQRVTVVLSCDTRRVGATRTYLMKLSHDLDSTLAVTKDDAIKLKTPILYLQSLRREDTHSDEIKFITLGAGWKCRGRIYPRT